MNSDEKHSDPLFLRWMHKNGNTDTPVIFDNSYRNLKDPLEYNKDSNIESL